MAQIPDGSSAASISALQEAVVSPGAKKKINLADLLSTIRSKVGPAAAGVGGFLGEVAKGTGRELLNLLPSEGDSRLAALAAQEASRTGQSNIESAITGLLKAPVLRQERELKQRLAEQGALSKEFARQIAQASLDLRAAQGAPVGAEADVTIPGLPGKPSTTRKVVSKPAMQLTGQEFKTAEQQRKDDEDRRKAEKKAAAEAERIARAQSLVEANKTHASTTKNLEEKIKKLTRIGKLVAGVPFVGLDEDLKAAVDAQINAEFEKNTSLRALGIKPSPSYFERLPANHPIMQYLNQAKQGQQ